MKKLTESQMNDIEADIRAAVSDRDFARASNIADKAAIELELALGNEAQTARLRMLANRWAERADMEADQ